MNSPAAQIGFDRYIPLEWIACALRIRAGLAEAEELSRLIGSAGLGREASAKSMTKIYGLVLRPHLEREAFVDRGLALIDDDSRVELKCAFAWGAAISTYPFFGKVGEIVGRLTMIQGGCSALEVHRRMSEVYGDRAVTKRATQAVLQTQASWGAIARVENGKRIVRTPPISIDTTEAATWLIEAALRYSDRPLSLSNLQSQPVLFPFLLNPPLTYSISINPSLELRSEGPSNQFVTLRTPV